MVYYVLAQLYVKLSAAVRELVIVLTERQC